jgi:hypothetical protein
MAVVRSAALGIHQPLLPRGRLPRADAAVSVHTGRRTRRTRNHDAPWQCEPRGCVYSLSAGCGLEDEGDATVAISGTASSAPSDQPRRGILWTRDCADPGFLWFEGAGMSDQLETSANPEHCPAIPSDHSHHWLPSGTWIGVFRLRGPYRGSTSGSSRHRVSPRSSSSRVFAG